MQGHIHSIQSLGAVDGPGVRCVVFLQGCPLRCAYCHNPDTWEEGAGETISAAALAEKVLRFRPYWKPDGGVTVSGGEPLLQAPFVQELFTLLHREGVHTALDTAGFGRPDELGALLGQTDLVLADLKFSTNEDYMRYTGGTLATATALLEQCARQQVPVWVRHVVVPGLNDTLDDMRRIRALAETCPTLERIEWLAFHNLCLEKYERLGIPFPLAHTPPMDRVRLERLVDAL